MPAVDEYAAEGLAAIQHPLMIVDDHCRVIWVNDLYYDAFQLTHNEVVGMRLDKIASGAWSDPALEKRIGETLQTGGPFRGHTLTIELEGVKVTAVRVAEEQKNAARQGTLERHKAELAAERSASHASAVGTTSDLRVQLEAQMANLRKVQADKAALAEKEKAHLAEIAKRYGETYGDGPTGAGGLFAAAQKSGEDFGTSMRGAIAGIMPVLQGLVDLLGVMARVLGPTIDELKWLSDPSRAITLRGILGPDIANALGVDMPGGHGVSGQRLTGNVLFPAHAAGGMVGLNGPEIGLLGEKGPEYVVPNHQLGGMGAWCSSMVMSGLHG